MFLAAITSLIPLNINHMSIKISLENQFRDRYADEQIFWAVIAKNNIGEFSYLTPAGTLIPIQVQDNSVPVPGGNNCAGENLFANYFSSLADVSEINFSEELTLESGQIWIGLGDWLPFCVNLDADRRTGFAPPSVTNPDLQGYKTPFQILEFTYNLPEGLLFINTSQVDALGFPVTLTVKAGNAKMDTVGFIANRGKIVNDFRESADAHFGNLIVEGDAGEVLRVLAPEHAAEGNGYIPPAGLNIPASSVEYFTSFYDAYIDRCYRQYASEPLTIYVDGIAYTGQVAGNVFQWYAGEVISGDSVLELRKPETWEVLACAGVLDTGNEVQKNIQKFVAAALFRTVFHLKPINLKNSWSDPDIIAQYYTHEPVNLYGKILHDNSISGLCYAFAYDDVNEQSPSIIAEGPKEISMIITDWD